MNAERDCYQDLKEQKSSQIKNLKETRLFYVFFLHDCTWNQTHVKLRKHEESS